MEQNVSVDSIDPAGNGYISDNDVDNDVPRRRAFSAEWPSTDTTLGPRFARWSVRSEARLVSDSLVTAPAVWMTNTDPQKHGNAREASHEPHWHPSVETPEMRSLVRAGGTDTAWAPIAPGDGLAFGRVLLVTWVCWHVNSCDESGASLGNSLAPTRMVERLKVQTADDTVPIDFGKLVRMHRVLSSMAKRGPDQLLFDTDYRTLLEFFRQAIPHESFGSIFGSRPPCLRIHRGVLGEFDESYKVRRARPLDLRFESRTTRGMGALFICADEITASLKMLSRLLRVCMHLTIPADFHVTERDRVHFAELLPALRQTDLHVREFDFLEVLVEHGFFVMLESSLICISPHGSTCHPFLKQAPAQFSTEPLQRRSMLCREVVGTARAVRGSGAL